MEKRNNVMEKQKRRVIALKQLRKKVVGVKATARPKQKSKAKQPILQTNQNLPAVKARPDGWKSNPYAMCRLDPFSSMGKSNGIPDGSNVRRLLIDHRMTTKLTFGPTGNLNLAITPMVPHPLLVQASDSGLLINGASYPHNNPNVLLYIPVTLPEWQTLPIHWWATEDKFNEATPLYSASRFRVVTCGYRIMYLGTSLTDSGMISVNTLSYSVEAPMPNGGNLTVYSSQVASNTVISDRQVTQSLVNAPQLAAPNTGFTSSETVHLALRDGAEGALSKMSTDHEFVTCSRVMNYWTFSNVDSTSLLMQKTQTPVLLGNSAVVNGYDSNWNTHMITVTGGTPGQTLVVDLVMCVEYVPQPNSEVYALAKAGPPENRALLQRVENYLKTRPIASTLNSLYGIAKTAITVGSALM